MSQGIEFDARDFTAFEEKMRRAARDMTRETDKTLLGIGAAVTATAKTIAGRHSSTVAGTITMRAAPGAVIIEAGSPEVPIAMLWEKGNKGSRDKDWFRHPVFGDRNVFVEQARYPFLRPAVKANRAETTRQLEKAWERTLDSSGLRMHG